MLMYYCCDKAGLIRESGSLGRKGWRESHGYSEVSRWQPLPVSIKDHAGLASMVKF
jgi:hypothetical protein